MIALDTNILVLAHQREADLHQAASHALRELAESPVPWAICCHSLVEFHGVATAPHLWRQPSTPEQAMDQIDAWRESPSLHVLVESDAVLDRLGQLAQQSKVRGSQVHEARIAACCLSYGVGELWTIDRDFSRYPELKTRNPLIAT